MAGGAAEALLTVDGGDSLLSVAASPDGQRLAFCSADGSVMLCSASTGEVSWAEEGHSFEATSVAFAPGGVLLASCGMDKEVRLWDVGAVPASPTPRNTLEGHAAPVRSVAFSPDGRLLASGGWDKVVLVWDLTAPVGPSLLHTLEGHSAPLRPNPLCTCTTVGAAFQEDPACKVKVGHKDLVFGVAWSPDGRFLASAAADKSVRLWDMGSPAGAQAAEASVLEHGGCVYAVAFSPIGGLLASGCAEGKVRLWDVSVPVPAVRHTLEGTGFVLSVAFSSDGRLLASGGTDRTARVWDVAVPGGPTLLQTLEGHTDYVVGVAFLAEGRLATACDDCMVRVWSIGSQ